jgi:hypothetical protein
MYNIKFTQFFQLIKNSKQLTFFVSSECELKSRIPKVHCYWGFTSHTHVSELGQRTHTPQILQYKYTLCPRPQTTYDSCGSPIAKPTNLSKTLHISCCAIDSQYILFDCDVAYRAQIVVTVWNRLIKIIR